MRAAALTIMQKTIMMMIMIVLVIIMMIMVSPAGQKSLCVASLQRLAWPLCTD